MGDPEIDRMLKAAADHVQQGGPQAYVPAQVVDIYAVSFQVVPHALGLALAMPCANGVLYQYPMDWNALQVVKRVVKLARLPGVGIASPVPTADDNGDAA